MAGRLGLASPMQHMDPPNRPGARRLRLLGEGDVGLTYLEASTGLPDHAVKYISAVVVAQARGLRVCCFDFLC